MRYYFGDFELAGDGRELRRRAGGEADSGVRIDAPPKVLAVLRTLLSAAPRVVTRSELLDLIWQGRTVSPSAVNTVVKSIRQLLDDTDQRFIRTMHGIGYAFVMPVERVTASHPAAPLREARERHFVGRERELAQLSSWFEPGARADVSRLYWVHGVGGIGKTSLLHQIEALALEHDLPVLTISCAHIRPSPEALMSAVAASSGASAASEIPRSLAVSEEGLLVLDGYEALGGIDDWVRERFVHRLPSGWRLLIASRNPPSARWRADPAWTCAVELPLGDLSAAEAELLLARRGVDASQREAIVSVAGGHPLALVLATSSPREGWSEADAGAAEGITGALLDCFVREVPSNLHREALECLALVDALDESLLAAMLDDGSSAIECFDWLSTLGMVERRPTGLVLHDLAKSALVSNLAWRNSPRLSTLVERVYTKVLTELEVATGRERQRRLVTLLWRMFELHPALAPLMPSPKLSGAPSVAELDVIAGHVERFEGRASAAALRFWAGRDPTCARVIRDDGGAIAGYSVLVDVAPGDKEARRRDPLLTRLDAALPPATGYAVARWFADCQAYHDVTPVSFGCHIINVERGLDKLDHEGWHFVLVSNPEAWEPLTHFASFRDREATFDFDGRRYTAFAHDTRQRSLLTLLRTYTSTTMGALAADVLPALEGAR